MRFARPASVCGRRTRNARRAPARHRRFAHKIAIASSMQAGDALAHKLAGSESVEERRRIVERKIRTIRESLDNASVFHLQMNWMGFHTAPPP